MLPSLPESLHYKNWANHYAGEAIALNCTASVHVEDSFDALFWRKMFMQFHPDKTFNFIWASNSLSEHQTTGCAQCLKYKDYLSELFIICIDSDYRYLVQQPNINASNFILQTYTYSVENHLCYTTKLNAIPEKCTGIHNTIFDFDTFLTNYSNTIYDSLIWHLYFIRGENNETFSKREFQTILSLNGMHGFSINENGKQIIEELALRCTAKVSQLIRDFPQIDIAAEKDFFSALGLTYDTAYLYVRGHNLFDLVLKIGHIINRHLLVSEAAKLTEPQQKKELFAGITPFEIELEKLIVFDEYLEINKIKEDVYIIIT